VQTSPLRKSSFAFFLIYNNETPSTFFKKRTRVENKPKEWNYNIVIRKRNNLFIKVIFPGR
jgi:hypothetical protein